MNIADFISNFDCDDSPATIRTLINDSLDSLEKDGYDVNHNYDQELAVKRVKSRIAANLSRQEDI